MRILQIFSATLLLTAGSYAQSPATAPAALTPEQERAAMHVMDGYDVTLFASEADGVVKPIQMRFDELGRLWVSCSPTYPQIEPGEKPNDKILVLEDTNNDGRCDKTTVFADGLFIPTGLEIVDAGRILVGTGTEMLLLSDTDGDLKADKREVFLSGFGTGDGHQMVNSFQWGPGGTFWFSQGAHTFSNVETPHGVERLYSAGIWRLRPRTMQLDPLIDSRRGHPTNSWAGPANPWGLAFDKWGQVFSNDAAGGKGLSWISPSLIRSDRHVTVSSMWRLPKGCGIDLVGSAGLPAEMQGRLVMAHYFTASVRQFELKDDGSGFTATELPPLVTADTNAFRTVDIKVGPDGAIWLCDWYNPVIGHYQASYRDPNRDRTHGRIWRLTSKTTQPIKPPQLAGRSVKELIDLLGTKDRWTEYQVNRLLFTGKSEEVVPAADAWVAKLDPATPDYEQFLYRAIGIFETHEAVRPALLHKLINAKDAGARAYAARVVAHWHDRLENPLNLLEKLVQDDSARVRVEAIVACSYIPEPKSIEVASMAADRPIDYGVDHAMLRAVDALKDVWRPAFLKSELSFGAGTKRLAWVIKSDGSPEMAGPIRRIMETARLTKEASHELASLLANIGGPEDLRVSFDWANEDPKLLADLAAAAKLRNVKPTGDLQSDVDRLLASPTPGVRASAVRLVGAWDLKPLSAKLRQFAVDPKQDAAVRVTAIKTLGELKEIDRPTLQPLLGDGMPTGVRVAAVAALFDVQRPVAAAEAAKLLAQLKDDDSIGSILALFVSKKGGAQLLGKAVKDGALPPPAAQKALDVLHARGRDDAPLVDALKAAMGVSDNTPAYSEQVVRQLIADTVSNGDAKRGQTVYDTKLVACAACHAINGKGGVLGPDISAIGRGLTPELIVESVLWPRRQVKEGYLSLSVTMNDGDEYSGYAITEDAAELQLKDVATNEVRRIPKADIRWRLNAGTIMPEGLTATLSKEELLDLFAYLMSLK